MGYPYRVFISYSSEAEVQAGRVEKRLKQLGAVVLSMRRLRPGQPFTREIRDMISFSHLFVWVFQKSKVKKREVSTQRKRRRLLGRDNWINQELGFATALGVPVVPISFGGGKPVGLAATVQALMLDIKARRKDLDRELGKGDLSRLVESHKSLTRLVPVLAAPNSQERTKSLISNMARVNQLSAAAQPTPPPAKIRHAAAFGTLSLPVEPPEDEVWKKRYGPHGRSAAEQSDYWRERQMTEALAAVGGCDLLLHPCSVEKPYPLPDGWRVRVAALIAFLERASVWPVRCRVVVSRDAIPGNVLIVGDWFVAESVSPTGRGFRDTIITRHAPSVLRRIDLFDATFETELRRYAERKHSNGPLPDEGLWVATTPHWTLRAAIEDLRVLADDGQPVPHCAASGVVTGSSTSTTTSP